MEKTLTTAKESQDNYDKAGPTSLQFEISEQATRTSSSASVGEQQEQRSSKIRIEAFISSEKLDAVLSAIGSLKLAATYYDSKGRDKGEKYTISYGRGVSSSKMAYILIGRQLLQ